MLKKGSGGAWALVCYLAERRAPLNRAQWWRRCLQGQLYPAGRATALTPSLRQQVRPDLAGAVGAFFFRRSKGTALCTEVLRAAEQAWLTHG